MKVSLKLQVVMILLVQAHAGAGEPYVIATGKTIRIGNDAVERVFRIDGSHARASVIVNRLSGARYNVQSDEFALSIVFGGLGPAVGKEQNGENPSVLTARDFQCVGTKQEGVAGGARTLMFLYSLDRYQARLRVTVFYQVVPGSPYMRKWIRVADSADAMHFLQKMDVERMDFQGIQPEGGAFGQPVFAGDIFIGVEYPGVENKVKGSHVSSGYVIGETLIQEGLQSETGVVGAASSREDVKRAFLRYVGTIKVAGTRPFLLYNTWYDVRHPGRVTSPAYEMTEANVLERIDAFRQYMQVPHGITLDAFVLDDGWDNVHSIWEIDSTTFPGGFARVAGALHAAGTKLGLWASPFCGYEMRDERVRWGASHGYEHTGDFLCLAGEKYGQEFQQRMVAYTREYGIGYFKWDGLLLACNETEHGHLPGVYSRPALIQRFTDVMAAVRDVNPKIFINITVGTWLSPWWLRYADCVWMQGEDYAYAEDVPSLNPRDKAITYRDAVLWDDLVRQNLVFPVSSMMTHGIIKGRLNLLGGNAESLESFTNEAVMYFGRGVMMWELYISPDALSTGEWHAIASCVKWARSQKDILSDTRMIGGNPLQRVTYGYVHSNGKRAIVLLRNPSVRPNKITISLGRDLGFRSATGKWRVMSTYPYHKVSGKSYRDRDVLEVPLGSYEVAMLDVIPSDEVPAGTPLDVRYVTSGDSIVVLGIPGSRRAFKFAGQKKEQRVRFVGVRNTSTAQTGGLQMLSDRLATIAASATVSAKGSPALFGLLFEPEERLSGKEAPQFLAEVDGTSQRPDIEQEGGKWFWTTVPLTNGKHNIKLHISGAKPLHGSAEIWLFSGESLAGVSTSKRMTGIESVELPLPYSPFTEKSSRFVESFEIGKQARR
jgi:hypothetical protein